MMEFSKGVGGVLVLIGILCNILALSLYGAAYLIQLFCRILK